MVAEELGDILYIRCLTATCACSRELEERLAELRCLHIALGVERSLVAYLAVEMIELYLLICTFEIIDHFESLFRFGKADIHTIAATCTVCHADAESVLVFFEVGSAISELGALRKGRRFFVSEQERPYGCVRTCKSAIVALDTFFSIPLRNHYCHAAFFIGGCAGGHCAVHIWKEGAHRQGVSGLSVHHIGDFFYKRSCKAVYARILKFGVDAGPS